MSEIQASAGNGRRGTPLQAENGLTVVNGKVRLGGDNPLLEDTSIEGAYTLNFVSASLRLALGTIAVGTLPTTMHKIYGYNAHTTNPTEGTAAGLFQTIINPAVAMTATNVYGSASTLDINFNAPITSPESYNVTAHLSSLVLRNNSGTTSTAPMSANRAGILLYGNIGTKSDIRVYNVRAFEDYSTGGTITAAYGLYIESLKIARIITAYGIYQVGANDINYLAGKLLVGTTTTTYAYINTGYQANTANQAFVAGTIFQSDGNGAQILFSTANGSIKTAGGAFIYMVSNGGFGFSRSGAAVTSATNAIVQIGPGTTSYAPLILEAGTNTTTVRNGAFEFDGTNLYFSTGGVRKTVTLV